MPTKPRPCVDAHFLLTISNGHIHSAHTILLFALWESLFASSQHGHTGDLSAFNHTSYFGFMQGASSWFPLQEWSPLNQTAPQNPWHTELWEKLLLNPFSHRLSCCQKKAWKGLCRSREDELPPSAPPLWAFQPSALTSPHGEHRGAAAVRKPDVSLQNAPNATEEPIYTALFP